MRALLAVLLLALSGVEGLAAQPCAAQPFLNKKWRGDRLLLAQSYDGKTWRNVGDRKFLSDWRPWQRRTVLLCTLAGAVALGYSAEKANSGATAVGIIGGGAFGFITGLLLVPAIDGVYYLWSGRHMEPWNTFRFSFPASQVG